MRPLDAVAIVTPEHGETFVEEFIQQACDTEAPIDAFGRCGIMTFPSDPASQNRFHAIVDQILKRTIEAVKPVIVESFVKAANDVLTKERKRGRAKVVESAAEVMGDEIAMSKDRRPAVPIATYFDSRPLLRHIRIMERFLHEVIDPNPKFRDDYAELHLAYLDILEEEFRPHALMLALAVAELERAYPEIERAKPPHGG